MFELKETILLSRIRKKDEKAFNEIYDDYVDKIHRFIFYRVRDPKDGEDLLQEVFFNLWKYLSGEEKRKVDHLKALIYQIAKNVIAAHYNKKYAREDRMIEVEHMENISDQDMAEAIKEPEENLDIKIGIEKIKEQLELLENDDYREIIEMRFIDELSCGEIARILEKSEGTVRVLLHRALKKVREKINNVN
jgi:RNA polymerase sigma-70 factor, ECF subfamily